MANDPYREPVDNSDPKASSFVPPSTTPVSPVTLPTEPPAPTVAPDGFIPNRGGTIPIPDVSPLIPDTTPVATAPAPVAGFGLPTDSAGIPASPAVSESAPVVPPEPTPAPVTPEVVQPKPLREIPLQDIPMPPQTKHGVFEPGVIMPPPVAPEQPPVSPNETPVPPLSASEPMTAPIPEPTPVVAPAPAPIAPEEDRRRSAIRTLQGDIAQTVHENNMSLAQMALAHQEREQETAPPIVTEDEKDTKSFVMGVVSTLLILGGLGVLAFVGYMLRDRFAVPFFAGNNETAPMIIPADRTQTNDVTAITRTGLLRSIDAFMKDPNAEPLKVRALVLNERPTATSTDAKQVSISRFMELLSSRAPGRLVRTLGPDYMLGAIGNEPFLLVRHTSYENAFASMLEWEPQLRDDVPFLAFASLVVAPTTPAATSTASTSPRTVSTSSPAVTLPALPIASTSPGDTLDQSSATSGVLPELPAVWKDIVIKNIDARALIRKDGQTLMLYAFLRDNLLLITAHTETMSVILDVLATPRFGE